MAHRLSRSSTSIVKKRCVGNDLYGASTCFPVKNGGEVAKSPPLQPRALSWASCTRVLYVFSLGQIYIRVCVHVWFVPTFFISSSIATSYTIHLPCQNTGSFVGADPFFLRHSYSTPCARIRRTNDVSRFFTQSTPYSSLNIRTLYDSDDERSSACWTRKNCILVPFLICMSSVTRSNTHAKISTCIALIFNAFTDEYRLLRTFLGLRVLVTGGRIIHIRYLSKLSCVTPTSTMSHRILRTKYVPKSSRVEVGSMLH